MHVLSSNIKCFLYTIIFLISGSIFANSSKEVVKERTHLLQSQHAQLEGKLIQPASRSLKKLKAINKTLMIERDVFKLKLTLASSEYQFFLQRLQQENKKLTALNSQVTYKLLQESIQYNTEMSQYSMLEVQWLKKNIEQVTLLISKNKKAEKGLLLDKLRFERQAEANKLKSEIKHLRTLNYELLKKKVAALDEAKEGKRFSQISESQQSLDDLTVSIRRIEIEKLQLIIKLNYSDYLRIRSGSLVTIEQLIQRLKEVGGRIEPAVTTLKAIGVSLDHLKDYWTDAISDKRLLKQLLDSLSVQSKHVNQLTEQFNALAQSIKNKLVDYEEARFKILKLRKGLIKDSLSQGRQIFNEFLKLPQASWVYFSGLYDRVIDFSKTLFSWQKFLYLSGLFLMIFFWLAGKRYQKRFITHETSSERYHFYSILNRLISKNWSALCLLGSLMFIFTVAGIPPLSYRLLLVIFIVWFVFRTIISITRLALLETLSNVEGHDVRLYHRLRLTFTVGGIVTVATVLSHYLHMHYLVLELIDRLFMIFLFSVSLVLLRGHSVLIVLIHNYLNPQKFYTKRALDLLTLLVPFSLLVNGAVGVLGYVSLAWDMGYYQAIIVLAVIFYVILRGILLDSLDKISQKMIKGLNNGWLLTEALLKPCYTILLYLLIIILTLMVFRLYGWDDNSFVVNSMREIWYLNLLSLSRVLITTKSLVFFIILVIFLTWLARWSREFCYRWLYHNVVDQGLRNSLSIFSQYTILTVGSIVTLTVLGIDISGISMILGGLAVGVGFGLRDFANNIVGGLVLLIERPVKEGDLISFGQLEGKVTHIGLRSMTIKSWDHYEVVLPNADLFIKPFTNWTHKDSIVRTVVAIKVNRYDSPLKVQRLVLDVLSIIPEVLKEPASEVFLKEINDVLVELEVRYYINVEINSRLEVRSNVLFAIMAQFKATGIKSPIQSLQVEYANNETS